MSDKKNGAKSERAQELLNRLAKKQDQSAPAPEKKASYFEFVTEREKEAPAVEENVDINAVIDEAFFDDSADLSSVYDEVFAEMQAEEESIEAFPPFIDDEPAEETAVEPLVEELPAEEYAEGYEEFDEYAQYFEGEEAEVEDFSQYAPEDYNEYYDDTVATYAEEAVAPEDGVFYEDVIPDDDFFDNDPLEDSYDEQAYEEEEQSFEDYDEEKDFENLFAEVTGGATLESLDEPDVSLMVALGMESELAKTVGEETAAQLTDDFVADQEEWVDRTNRFGADEYSDLSQNAEIAREYTKKNRFAFWKMILALGLTVLIMFYENLPLLGYQLSGALDPARYPVVYAMIDLQITFFAAALVIGRLFKGVKDLVGMKPSVDCFPAILLVGSVVNTVVMVVNNFNGLQPKMFNFVVVLCMFFTALNEYMTVRREIFSFNIVSSKKPKYVMRRLSQRDSVLESEAVADMDAQSADDGDIIKIQKTDFVDGYFWRTKIRGTVGRSIIGLSIVISLVLAVVIAVYSSSIDSLEESPVTIGFAVLCAAAPVSMLVSGFYPFYRANRRAYDNDCTIIGEGSVEEYSGVSVISFDDVNVFPSYSVKVRNVRLFNNSRIDKVLYYAASVFSATGGPLADVFEVATMETGHSDNVTVLETGNGYIEAEVNGKSIMFGRSAALARHGILIPDSVIQENSEIPADCSVMYMIYQHKLVAKMIVNYVIDPDFEYVLKQLTGSGLCVCVKTFDPNIDEEMICRQIPQGKYSMRVIKYKNTEEITKYSKRAEGGVISRGNTKALLHTVSNCDKIISAQKTGFAVGMISAVINAVILAVVLMSGSFTAIHSAYIALCQLFWLLPAVITTKLIVR